MIDQLVVCFDHEGDRPLVERARVRNSRRPFTIPRL